MKYQERRTSQKRQRRSKIRSGETVYCSKCFRLTNNTAHGICEGCLMARWIATGEAEDNSPARQQGEF